MQSAINRIIYIYIYFYVMWHRWVIDGFGNGKKGEGDASKSIASHGMDTPGLDQKL